MSNIKLKSPIFLALDVDDQILALKLAHDLSDFVGGFKVGPRLTYKYGADFVKKLAEFGPVFVDNKYHDIPSTVVAALRASFYSGATFATVHASHGLRALKEFKILEEELNLIRPFHILAVTVLTSFDSANLPSNWVNQSIDKHVLDLAKDVDASGLSGIVCSPEEVESLRRLYPKFFLVTPGIRLAASAESSHSTAAMNDQSRIATPQEALRRGASALVIGRPILAANDPVAAARAILKR